MTDPICHLLSYLFFFYSECNFEPCSLKRVLKPFPKRQNLDSSKLLQTKTSYLTKMAESSPNGVENTMVKGEIARYEQFLLFLQRFQKTCTADTLKPGLVWERAYPNPPPQRNYRLRSVCTVHAGLAEPHSSVGSVAGLRTGGRWCDPRLGLYFFRRSMIVIATGFIPFSTLSVVSTMVMWESSKWLGRNIQVGSTG